MVALQSTWTWLPAFYLFLGGLGAGAFITVGVLNIVKPARFRKTISAGVWIAFIALAVGLLCLVSEVERPFAAMVLFKSFTNTASWMTIGAWLLFATLAVYVLALLFMTDFFAKLFGKKSDKFEKGRRIPGILVTLVGIVLSAGVAIYTGILLGAAPAVPFWNIEKLPVLFTVSAVDTGIAAVIIAMILREDMEDTHKGRVILEVCTVTLIIAEAVLVYLYLTFMQAQGGAAAISAGMLTEGQLSVVFWVLFVAIGLAVPALCAVAGIALGGKAEKAKAVRIIAIGGAACALVGGLVLRLIVLAAGIHEPLVSPDFLQAAEGLLWFVG